jgi:lipopolysaccharide biosynthesis glycosyltransferase
MTVLNVCIGYDHRESIAFHVLAHSILRRASRPVSIVPLALSALPNYTRPRSPMQSTDFTYSRFLTPSMADDNAVSIFMDCDMLCLTDICELEDIARRGANPYHDVLVVQHDYTPRDESKFLSQPQTTYPCKNWSSLIVFNGWRSSVKALTSQVVNTAEAMHLHQFKWCQSVGKLPCEWNHLVGEYEHNPDAKIVHYTLGGPWFKGYERCEYSEEWYAELADMLHRDSPSFDLIRQWRYY